MIARIQKSMKENEEGFTLIELLVVMIIIGILAAIAIPVFLSQRAKAQDSAAKADVSTIGKELATYYVDGTTVPTLAMAGTTPDRYTLQGSDIGKASANTALNTSGTITSDTKWCVGVTNTKGSQQTYKYSAKGGLAPGLCVAADSS